MRRPPAFASKQLNTEMMMMTTTTTRGCVTVLVLASAVVGVPRAHKPMPMEMNSISLLPTRDTDGMQRTPSTQTRLTSGISGGSARGPARGHDSLSSDDHLRGIGVEMKVVSMAASPPLPDVPSQWTAPLTLIAEGATYTGGYIHQDGPNKR
jgi:hypothetical protein